MLFLLLFFSAVLASKKPISSFSLETNLREHITYILTEAAAKIFWSLDCWEKQKEGKHLFRVIQMHASNLIRKKIQP